ncbi:hornerin-like [Belonocnema kinseyi]|uniref:hornerin-like n=1 Tax=Belonocnema kinseyi TaxID=2817044 RepID=UPI00143E0D13|nr:hornerin-like [Belonocnema kinseyi]
MKIGVLFLTLAVSTNAYQEGIVMYNHDPEKVHHPDGEPMIIDDWDVGATTATGFHPNTLNYKPVIVRKGNGLVRSVTPDELNKLLTDPTFRIPGPRSDHVPYEEHYAERSIGSHNTGNPYGQHLGGMTHVHSFGVSQHEQPYELSEQIFGRTPHQQQYAGSPRFQHGASPVPLHGGASPRLQYGAGSFPGGAPGHPIQAQPSAAIPNRHITSESRSNSELSVGSRGSQRSRGSRGSQSSRHVGGIPNLHQPGDANAGPGGIPKIPRGSPHVQFAGSGSLEQFAESPRSQNSGASQGSYRSGSVRQKSRLGPGGIPAGHPGSMPVGGSQPHQFSEHPNPHITSGGRSNSELSVGSQGSQGSEGSLGSQGSHGSRMRNPAGSGQPPQFPAGHGQQPEYPGGYPYEGSYAGSQDGYDSAGSGRSHNSAGSGRSHNSAGSGRSHTSAQASKVPTPSGEKKSKKSALSNLFKKIKLGSSKKPSS